jgi:hypothetical protein
MATFRLKRGNQTKIDEYTGLSGEIILNTDTNRIHVMDGVTAGGMELAHSSQIPSALSELNNDVGFSAGGGGSSVGVFYSDVGTQYSMMGFGQSGTISSLAVTTQAVTDKIVMKATGQLQFNGQATVSIYVTRNGSQIGVAATYNNPASNSFYTMYDLSFADTSHNIAGQINYNIVMQYSNGNSQVTGGQQNTRIIGTVYS